MPKGKVKSFLVVNDIWLCHCTEIGDSLHGDRADLCRAQNSHSCVQAWMFDLALLPIPFHQQQKSP